MARSGIWTKSLASGLFAAAIAACAAHAQNAPSPATHPEEENSGQDPTRPVARVDLRLKYQDNPGGSETAVFTARADKPFLLGGDWKLNTRIDLPLINSNAATAANPGGDSEIGLGDILLQALFIAPPKGNTAFAFGSQLIIPTGSDDQFTTGKWQLVPTAAFIYQLPEISRGTFVGLLVRDAFSFAGDDDRAGINNFSVQPIFNWQLPERWFLTFSPEAKFNTKDDWSLFLPFDVTVGRKVNANTVMSLQADVAVVDDFPQYDWQVEFRVGLFF